LYADIDVSEQDNVSIFRGEIIVK